jgi:hypothetical protein
MLGVKVAGAIWRRRFTHACGSPVCEEIWIETPSLQTAAISPAGAVL